MADENNKNKKAGADNHPNTSQVKSKFLDNPYKGGSLKNLTEEDLRRAALKGKEIDDAQDEWFRELMKGKKK